MRPFPKLECCDSFLSLNLSTQTPAQDHRQWRVRSSLHRHVATFARPGDTAAASAQSACGGEACQVGHARHLRPATRGECTTGMRPPSCAAAARLLSRARGAVSRLPSDARRQPRRPLVAGRRRPCPPAEARAADISSTSDVAAAASHTARGDGRHALSAHGGARRQGLHPAPGFQARKHPAQCRSHCTPR